MSRAVPNEITMIPIRQIDILNPRLRDQKVFKGIVDNIANVGIKKPIHWPVADSCGQKYRWA